MNTAEKIGVSGFGIALLSLFATGLQAYIAWESRNDAEEILNRELSAIRKIQMEQVCTHIFPHVRRIDNIYNRIFQHKLALDNSESAAKYLSEEIGTEGIEDSPHKKRELISKIEADYRDAVLNLDEALSENKLYFDKSESPFWTSLSLLPEGKSPEYFTVGKNFSRHVEDVIKQIFSNCGAERSRY